MLPVAQSIRASSYLCIDSGLGRGSLRTSPTMDSSPRTSQLKDPNPRVVEIINKSELVAFTKAILGLRVVEVWHNQKQQLIDQQIPDASQNLCDNTHLRCLLSEATFVIVNPGRLAESLRINNTRVELTYSLVDEHGLHEQSSPTQVLMSSQYYLSIWGHEQSWPTQVLSSRGAAAFAYCTKRPLLGPLLATIWPLDSNKKK